MQALIWGLVSGSALLVGAAVGWGVRLGRRWVAAVMAFGSGILVSAIAFDLMDESFRTGGLPPAAVGFLVGALIFTAGSVALARAGARHRKRSAQKPAADDTAAAVALGTVIDGIPESIAVGLSLIDGKGVAVATVIAIFLSNIPEALSSTSGMKAAGRSARYVFGLWSGVAVMSGIASLVGYAVFAQVPPEGVAATQAIAAGALLAMITDTMVPEAFAETRDAAGLISALGFLAGFALSHGLG